MKEGNIGELLCYPLRWNCESHVKILWQDEFPGGQSFSPKVLEGYMVMIVMIEPYQQFKATDFS